VVDGGVGGDLAVVGYVAVGELAADDVGVLGEGGVGGGEEFDVVGNGGVVVAIWKRFLILAWFEISIMILYSFVFLLVHGDG